jgi:translation initiation factor eIF-2B subunit epsilon
LEFLANAGVDEVFVYCGAHADQVEEYISCVSTRKPRTRVIEVTDEDGISRSRWSLVSSPFSKLEIIRSTGRSMGDAMRDLDRRGMLVGDFIVVYGDVVSNLPLEEALAAHRARRTKDRNAIMTMVLREAGGSHRTKEQGVRPVFVIDPTKDRCLHFEQLRPKTDEGHFVSIEPEVLAENQEIEIRQDLIDCGIDICTPEALSLWSDNFDYEAPRKGYLHGVLKDYELNGKTIHTHIVNDHYAARARNLHAYDAISRDVISRWAYPICPDTNLLRGQTYRMQKGNIYKEAGVVLSRSCVISPNTVVGNRSSIGDRSVLSSSVIGKRCTIGKNVRIEGAYIWDDVHIKDGAVINRAIIASNAEIGKDCQIQPGALVSYGVVVQDGVTVSGSSKLTKQSESDANNLGYDYEGSDEDEETVGGATGLGKYTHRTSRIIELITFRSVQPVKSLSFRRIYFHPPLGLGLFG